MVKQNKRFAGVSCGGFPELIFFTRQMTLSLLLFYNPCFYDEVFLNFAYSESHLLKKSRPKNYEISKRRRYFVLNSTNFCVGHAYKTGFNFLGFKNTA
jgi:hypothetical protein